MNMNMMNSPYFRNMMNNMTPDMMKSACKNIDSMSDDQLKSMMASSGMGYMDVNTFRQMSKTMSNSSNDDLNKMSQKAKDMTFQNTNTTSNPNNSSTTNKTNTNSSTNNSTKSKNVTTDDVFNDALNRNSSKIEQLERVKEKGNSLFKEAKYAEAKEKYFELMNNINEMNIESDSKEYKDLEKLKIVVRLNIANCLLKLNDYEMAIYECNKVLSVDSKNFKANYRTAMAYQSKKDYEKAKTFYNKALNSDCSTEEINTVKECLLKINKLLGNNDNEKSNSFVKSSEKESFTSNNVKEEEKLNKENTPISNFNNDKNTSVNENKTTEFVEKEKKSSTVQSILGKELNSNSKKNETKENDNIIIETVKEKIPEKNNNQTNSSSSNPSTPYNSFNPLLFDEKSIEESKKSFENMVR